jgi:phospholipid transport system substrate-binding protein
MMMRRPDLAGTLGLTRRTMLAAGTSLLAISLFRIPPAGAQETPSAFMDEIGQQVVQIFRTPNLSDQQRLSRLVQILDDSVDFETVSRLVIGRYWRQASPQQQEEYTELFREFTITTIASQLRNYGGETYEITGQRQVDDTDFMVSSKIVRTKGQQPANVDWRVREKNGRYAIIDVVGEGVSAVVTWRQEYSDILEQQGFDGLIARLKDQIAARQSA